MLIVLIGIASMRRFQLENTACLHIEENRNIIPIMPPDLALSSTLIGSSYPCLELIFMVPKVFEPLKFDCIYLVYSSATVLRIHKFHSVVNEQQVFTFCTCLMKNEGSGNKLLTCKRPLGTYCTQKGQNCMQFWPF